jgi:hypothetical protein
MAAKKVGPKVEVKLIPKRFEKGYRFPVMAEITDVEDGNDGQYYSVELVRRDLTQDMWGREKFIEIESDCNPKALKEYLSDKLKVAQTVVNSLTKEIAALDKA